MSSFVCFLGKGHELCPWQSRVHSSWQVFVLCFIPGEHFQLPVVAHRQAPPLIPLSLLLSGRAGFLVAPNFDFDAEIAEKFQNRASG